MNLCDSWHSAIEAFADIDYQRRIWFHQEGPEVSDFDEDINALFYTSEVFSDRETQELLNPQCLALIDEFMNKIDQYRYEPANGLTPEEVFHSDPTWLSIVKLAQEVCQALEDFKKEIENDD